jgi:hypothetical protein
VAGGNACERQFVTVQAIEDFRFDRFQAKRPCAATIPGLGRISCRAAHERGEIVQMTDHEVAQFWCRHAQALNGLSVTRQQLMCVDLMVRIFDHL